MKKIAKHLLRFFIRNVGIRGRHRLANKVGGFLSDDTELIIINGFAVEIDHSLESCRYIYYGLYEEGLINFLKHNIRSGDVVFDPGANIGYITAVCSGLVGDNGHVHAFEPSFTCYNQIINNNKTLPDNVTMNNAAIGISTDMMEFYDTPVVISRGYACLANVSTPINGKKYVVQVYAIDDYCEANQIGRIRFLKLDVEGSELNALLGANEMLSSGAIDFILVETLIKNENASISNQNTQIETLLRRHGYEPFLAGRNGRLLPFSFEGKQNFRSDIIWKLKQ